MFNLLIGLMLLINSISGQSNCRNPNQKEGTCISVYDCPSLLAVISKIPLPDKDRLFLQQSQCTADTGRFPHLCCTEDSGFIRTTPAPATVPVVRTTATPEASNGQGNILPQPPTCGYNPVGNKIYGGTEAQIDEYSWMVLLEYTSKGSGRKSLNCAGSLINQRYVLTAAHCTTGSFERSFGPLTGIRLGEHDTSKAIDCQGDECADPIQEAGIEDIIIHEGFSPRVTNKQNDIALLRMDRDIAYTAYITPICLPGTVNFQRSPSGASLIVAGWGTTMKARQSETKQKLDIDIVDQTECKNLFGARNLNIVDSQICAGGQPQEDSCDGDSGGPLMRFVATYWVLEGIVSFGNRCGIDGWPGVYTRVSSYNDWILENMRA